MPSERSLLSIVIPAYNEASNIEPFYSSLHAVLAQLPMDSEIIYVNDGSRDATLAQIRVLTKIDPSIRIINFTRNFGKEIATTAGIEHARGDAIITIDADGQHPPELIPKFIEEWRSGAQVVTGARISNRKEKFLKRYGSKLFYKIVNTFGGTNLTPNGTDFRLIDASVQKTLLQFTERSRIMRGLVDWAGFRETTVQFHTNVRMAGDPTYSPRKLVKLAIDSFVSLSLTPLYFSGYAGLVLTPVALLGGITIIIEQFVLGDPWHWNITGTAMLGVLLLFFVGIILISQGLIALYISHIHTETQNRPLYIIDEQNSLHP